MARIKRLVIPLAKTERKAIEDWAKRERLPMATVARRVLLDRAGRCVQPAQSQAIEKGAKP